MVMATEVWRNVTGGMITNGIFVLVDVAGFAVVTGKVAGFAVVTGKVAWFGGRVYMKDDGVILCTGLIL